MNRKLKYYLIGFFLGCVVLMVLPKPFERNKQGLGSAQHEPHGLFPLTIKDGYDREITITAPSSRIVSLAPSVTEILFALHAEDRLIANTDFCKYPPKAQEYFKIGDIRHPNVELMVQLRPGIVIGTVLTSPNIYNHMQAAGLTAVALEHSDLDSVLADISTIGKILGIAGEAIKLTREIENKRDEVLQTLETHAADLSRPKVLLLYDLDGLYSAGKDSWPGDLIELCHAENAAASAPSPWPQLSLEGLVAINPDIVILAVPQGIATRQAATQSIAALKNDTVWQHINAVKNDRVAIIDKEPFDIPGPRMIVALESLARAIHPEVFAGQK